MSLRTNMYMGSGARTSKPNPMPGGFGTTGGAITIDPTTGQPTITPKTVGHPILDRIFNRGGASAAAGQFNDTVVLQQLVAALNRQNEKASNKERSDADIDKSLADHYHMTPEDAKSLSPKARDVLSNQMDAELGRQTGKATPNLDPAFRALSDKAGNATQSMPVWAAQRASQVDLSPGSTTQFAPQGNPNVPPTIGQGSSLTSTDMEPSFDPATGKMVMVPKRTQTMTPGSFTPSKIPRGPATDTDLGPFINSWKQLPNVSTGPSPTPSAPPPINWPSTGPATPLSALVNPNPAMDPKAPIPMTDEEYYKKLMLQRLIQQNMGQMPGMGTIR